MENDSDHFQIAVSGFGELGEEFFAVVLRVTLQMAQAEEIEQKGEDCESSEGGQKHPCGM